MTTKMLGQLISEFRQLQIEVTELKAAGQRVTEVKDVEGSIRYQVYYARYYEQEARSLLADGLAAFLNDQGPSWAVKSCAVAIIKPEAEEKYWGAIRLDVAVYSLSALIKLRKGMKKRVEAANLMGQPVRTRKPVASSQLYSMDVEAQWNGSLKEAVDQIRGHVTVA